MTHDLELASIVHTLKMWRQYLMGRRFLLETKNISLKYFLDKHNFNARQEICLDFLRKYDFEIKHIKGKENKIVDTLSKKINANYSSNYQYDLK